MTTTGYLLLMPRNMKMLQDFPQALTIWTGINKHTLLLLPPVSLCLSRPDLYVFCCLSIEEMVAFPAWRQLLPSGLVTDGGTLAHAYECKCPGKLFFPRPLNMSINPFHHLCWSMMCCILLLGALNRGNLNEVWPLASVTLSTSYQ